MCNVAKIPVRSEDLEARELMILTQLKLGLCSCTTWRVVVLSRMGHHYKPTTTERTLASSTHSSSFTLSRCLTAIAMEEAPQTTAKMAENSTVRITRHFFEMRPHDRRVDSIDLFMYRAIFFRLTCIFSPRMFVRAARVVFIFPRRDA